MGTEYNIKMGSSINAMVAFTDSPLSSDNSTKHWRDFYARDAVVDDIVVSSMKLQTVKIGTGSVKCWSLGDFEVIKQSEFKIRTLKNDSYDHTIDIPALQSIEKNSSFVDISGHSLSQILENSADDFYDELLVALYSDDSQLGEPSRVKDLIVELYNDNRQAFFSAYQKLWLDLYESGNDDALYSLIMKSASLPNEYFSSYAKVMVCGCTNHESIIIQEAAIKAVDMWGDAKFIDVLTRMRKFDISWLEQYRLSVIDSLQRAI
ncbi:hypothetical protein K3H43_00040 [Aeromonas veronii]|uniref:hypothetical protein n=1 Tax=Aeromonas veronii TaxID=654 RepID=UPI001F172D35|nr:hypothetical protein [Aeromonas veronii]MCF5725780.1 hypothetical protein [Aeromonas veronii]